MTRNYSKSQIAAYASALAFTPSLPGLTALAVTIDDFREAAAAAARLSAMARIAPPPMTITRVITLKANLDKLSRDLRRQSQSTCDGCCHYQAHPPRCQLSKRSISPKQFSCKKYSPKFNARK